MQVPLSWSSDGQTLAFGNGQDVWLLPLGGEPIPVLTMAAREIGAASSPNGRWLAYVSDESGRDEIYVQPYPEAGRRWTISTSGGRAPLWSQQGDELYYRHENRVMVVPVETDPTFSNGVPRMLFEGSYLRSDRFGMPYYDVSPDGQRFLMLTSPSKAGLHVVLNWFEELERLVPTEN